MWWRIFIPSWRFFDQEGLRPELWIFKDGDWRRIGPPSIPWFALFYNSRFNRFHAVQNLLERLIVEMQSSPPEKLVSYRLVEWLAREEGASAFKILARGETVLMMEPGR